MTNTKQNKELAERKKQKRLDKARERREKLGVTDTTDMHFHIKRVCYNPHNMSQEKAQRNVKLATKYYVDGWTLSDIGNLYDISDERVRQIVRLITYQIEKRLESESW